MTEIPRNITGCALADIIEREADRRDLTAVEFARDLSRYPGKWLSQLRIAESPKEATIARVKALLEGEAVPPPPPNNFHKNGPRRAPLFARMTAGPPIETLPKSADRDPCLLCGVRRDIGCRHRPAEGAPPPAILDPREKINRSRLPRPGQGYNFHRRKGD